MHTIKLSIKQQEALILLQDGYLAIPKDGGGYSISRNFFSTSTIQALHKRELIKININNPNHFIISNYGKSIKL